MPGGPGQSGLCLGTAILSAFGSTKRRIDRRLEPSHGYRAVHVVVRCQGRWIEVQIRTRLQHMWAEVAERLADMWGRQIRYGMPPDDPERPFGDQMTRRGFVDLWIEGTSQVIANFEIGAQGIEEADRLVDEAGAETRNRRYQRISSRSWKSPSGKAQSSMRHCRRCLTRYNGRSLS